jgi:hypothetical protein
MKLEPKSLHRFLPANQNLRTDHKHSNSPESRATRSPIPNNVPRQPAGTHVSVSMQGYHVPERPVCVDSGTYMSVQPLISGLPVFLLPNQILYDGVLTVHSRRRGHQYDFETYPHLPPARHSPQLVQKDQLAQYYTRCAHSCRWTLPDTHHTTHTPNTAVVNPVLLLHRIWHHRRLSSPLESSMLLRTPTSTPISCIYRRRSNPG